MRLFPDSLHPSTPAPFIAEAGGREAELALISAAKSRSGPDLWLAARDSSGTAPLRSI